jgi:hypothetical protein
VPLSLYLLRTPDLPFTAPGAIDVLTRATRTEPSSTAATDSGAAGGFGIALDARPAYVTVARTGPTPCPPAPPIESAPVLDNITAVDTTHAASRLILWMRAVITFSSLRLEESESAAARPLGRAPEFLRVRKRLYRSFFRFRRADGRLRRLWHRRASWPT